MAKRLVKSFTLCEDIREEKSGKLALIGVFTGGIIFHSPFPARYRPLNFVFRLDGPKVAGRTAKCKLVAPNRKAIFSTEIHVDEVRSGNAILSFMWTNPEFKVPGVYNVHLELDGKRVYSDAFDVSSDAAV